MCKLFEDWSDDIRQYCRKHELSFDKAKELSQCWGSNFLALQYHDPEKGKIGLLDETPMPLVLFIKKDDSGELVFEQTEYTRKYLA